jgi:1,4-dihydroxy-2-naphthoate octaprenyltransferase
MNLTLYALMYCALVSTFFMEGFGIGIGMGRGLAIAIPIIVIIIVILIINNVRSEGGDWRQVRKTLRTAGLVALDTPFSSEDRK